MSRFQKGQSGNPKGRPVGSKNKFASGSKKDNAIGPNCVYVFGTHGGHYKIGISRSPLRRLQSVQCYVPYKVYLIDYTVASINALDIEQALHSTYAHCRTFGEWFCLSDDELSAVLQHIKTNAKSDVPMHAQQTSLFFKLDQDGKS